MVDTIWFEMNESRIPIIRREILFHARTIHGPTSHNAFGRSGFGPTVRSPTWWFPYPMECRHVESPPTIRQEADLAFSTGWVDGWMWLLGPSKNKGSCCSIGPNKKGKPPKAEKVSRLHGCMSGPLSTIQPIIWRPNKWMTSPNRLIMSYRLLDIRALPILRTRAVCCLNKIC